MIRKSTHSVEAVLSTYEQVMDGGEANHHTKTKATFEGDSIKFSSSRLRNFYEHGVECVDCGLEGAFFAKEKHTESDRSYHLNLYAYDENDEEVLMTKDHTIPKSKGGECHIDNYQPMCQPCNQRKGDSVRV